jgi:hypothetical protein
MNLQVYDLIYNIKSHDLERIESKDNSSSLNNYHNEGEKDHLPNERCDITENARNKKTSLHSEGGKKPTQEFTQIARNATLYTDIEYIQLDIKYIGELSS